MRSCKLQLKNPKDCIDKLWKKVCLKVDMMNYSCFHIFQYIEPKTQLGVEFFRGEGGLPSLGFALLWTTLFVIHSIPSLQGHPVHEDVQGNEQRKKEQIIRKDYHVQEETQKKDKQTTIWTTMHNNWQWPEQPIIFVYTSQHMHRSIF